MTDLIADLEAGPGSRELSDRVLEAVGARIDGCKGLFYLHGRIMDSAKRPSPTRSVDDALALVPGGWHWQFEKYSDAVFVVLDQTPDTTVSWDALIPSEAKTLPLAICIAVLRVKHGQD